MKINLFFSLLLAGFATIFGGCHGATAARANEAWLALHSGNTTLVYSKHARCRMDCRHINEAEVREILDSGSVNYSKIEQSSKGPSYPLEGEADGHHLRIVFAPHENKIVVVTCIDLDHDWPCDCGGA